MKTILVTGAGGFIGRNLAIELAKNNKIIAVDNNKRGSLNTLKHKNILHLKKDVTKKFNDKKFKNIDQIVHLAAINGTNNFYKFPKDVFSTGILGCINTIDLANKIGVKKYVLFSTSEIYNNPSIIPTPELVPAIIPDIENPRFSYSGSKIFSELMAHHCLNKDITKVIIRPHNIYGQNMGTKHVIPELIIKLIKEKKKSKKILDIKLQGSGNETRSFCHITDFIRAYKLIDKSNLSGTFNIGNNEEISINSLIKKISKVLNLNLNPIFKENLKKYSPNRRCPDIKKIKKLGYSQKITLEKGLIDTYQWYQKNFEKFRNKITF